MKYVWDVSKSENAVAILSKVVYCLKKNYELTFLWRKWIWNYKDWIIAIKHSIQQLYLYRSRIDKSSNWWFNQIIRTNKIRHITSYSRQRPKRKCPNDVYIKTMKQWKLSADNLHLTNCKFNPNASYRWFLILKSCNVDRIAIAIYFPIRIIIDNFHNRFPKFPSLSKVWLMWHCNHMLYSMLLWHSKLHFGFWILSFWVKGLLKIWVMGPLVL